GGGRPLPVSTVTAGDRPWAMHRGRRLRDSAPQLEHYVQVHRKGVLARGHRRAGGVHGRRAHRIHRLRGLEAAAFADAHDPAHAQSERLGIHAGPGAGLLEGGVARLVVDRLGLVDPEARAADVVGAAGDQRVEYLAQAGDVTHLQAHGVAGAVAADARLFVLDVAIGGVDVDAGGLDVTIGDAGGADGLHHARHL